MRIIHTVASIHPDHGGTSRSVPALCEALAGLGTDVHLVTGMQSRSDGPALASRLRVHTVGPSRHLGQLGVARGFQAKLSQLATQSAEPVIVHDHGLWLPSNHAVASFCRKNKIRRVVAPRGMASPWSLRFNRMKKSIAWILYQRRDLASASVLHATSRLEADELRDLGFNQPVAVLPNAVAPPSSGAVERPQRRRALFFSRIHPKKGLINLVRAWKQANVSPEWELMIAGPDECGHRAEVEREVHRLELGDRVQFRGPVKDSDKWDIYRAAELFVLPSFSENFGIVVAEALAVGIPVITSTGTPWSDLVKLRSGWWVEPTVDEVSTALSEATNLSRERLAQMGERGRYWIQEEFSWQAIAQKATEFYRWLAEAGPQPDEIFGAAPPTSSRLADRHGGKPR